jgi:hypothetical protein
LPRDRAGARLATTRRKERAVPPIRSIDKHRDVLMEPPEAWLKEKLSLFGVSPSKLAKLPSLVVSGQRKPVGVSARDGFSVASYGDLKRHSAPIKIRSLDHLKEVAGVPNRAFAKTDQTGPAIAVDEQALAKLPRGATFAKLKPEQQMAVWQAARALMYRPADDQVLARPGYELVANMALQLARRLRLFLAPDLVVTDGQSVRFDGFGVLYFNNVIVYGSGSIDPGANTKLHAYSIAHV